MTIQSDKIFLSSKEVAGFLKKTCTKGIPFKFTAKGMSMSPFICDGDSLIIEPLLKGKVPGTGDIVAFINPVRGYLVIHRVIQRQNERSLLKGDNVYFPDEYCDNKDIHGIVKKIIIAEKIQGSGWKARKFFLFLNNFKKVIAFFSRYKLLTLMCRLANKLIKTNKVLTTPYNENQY